MKTLLKLIFVLSPILSSGQTFRELLQQRDLGYGIVLYSFDGYSVRDSTFTMGTSNISDTVALSSSASYGISVFTGWNFPIVELGETTSLGINPNLAFTAGLSGGLGMFLEAPVFLTLKYGTDAVWSQSNTFDKKFGLALGIGFHGVLGYSEAPIATTGIGMAYLRPAVMSEFSFVTNENRVNKIRFNIDIGTSRSIDYKESVGYPAMVSYTQFQIAYIRTIYGQ